MGRHMFGDRLEDGTTGVCWDSLIHELNQLRLEDVRDCKEGCSAWADSEQTEKRANIFNPRTFIIHLTSFE